jgi:uncharacterized membrane protein required for colicin V production/uncharacterized protein YkwD
MSPTDVSVYDLVVAAVAAALVVRGWLRGALREAIEVAVLIVGVALVFRLSPVVGSIIAGMANVPYEVARIFAGVVLFLGLVVGGAVAARLISTTLRLVPGTTIVNRLGGAIVGAGYAVLVVALGTTLLSAAPLPRNVRLAVDGSIDSSLVGQRIVEPHGMVQQSMSTMSGERVFATVIALQEMVGSRLVAGTLPVPLPDVGESTLASHEEAAREVFDSMNRERISEGLDPLGWSSELAVVAVDRADHVYRSGRLALDSDLGAALGAAGIPGTINSEMVALAASPDGVAEAFTGASVYRATIVDQQYRRAGIGIIDGPFGLLAVQVLAR